MKNIIPFLPLFILLISCSNNQSKTTQPEKEDVVEMPKIHTKTFTSQGNSENNEVKTTESTSILSEIYFEIEFHQLEDESLGYIAQKDIEKSDPGDVFRWINMVICTEDGDNKYFKTSTDFLNYMFECGYDMQDQTKHQYYTDYTFKKK